MFGFKKDKERERFYLLPGMGGRAYRRKQSFILKVAIIVGLLVGGLFALMTWFIHSSPR
jgi:hypothetical protein